MTLRDWGRKVEGSVFYRHPTFLDYHLRCGEIEWGKGEYGISAEEVKEDRERPQYSERSNSLNIKKSWSRLLYPICLASFIGGIAALLPRTFIAVLDSLWSGSSSIYRLRQVNTMTKLFLFFFFFIFLC